MWKRPETLKKKNLMRMPKMKSKKTLTSFYLWTGLGLSSLAHLHRPAPCCIWNSNTWHVRLKWKDDRAAQVRSFFALYTNPTLKQTNKQTNVWTVFLFLFWFFSYARVFFPPDAQDPSGCSVVTCVCCGEWVCCLTERPWHTHTPLSNPSFSFSL